MTHRTALLFGATGLVGHQCLKQLLAEETYSNVVLFLRNPVPMTHPKLKQHMINFDQLQKHADLIRGDDVYWCLGTTMRKADSPEAFEKVDFTYPHEIAKLASVNGVQQFLLVSSVGADPSSANFYLKTKGRVEEALKTVPFRSLLIFRPSFLLGNRKDFRLGERIGITAMKALTVAPVDALKKYRPITASAVSNALVITALKNLKGVHLFESDEIQSIGIA